MFPKSKLDVVSKVRAAIRRSDYIDQDEAGRKKIAIDFVNAFKKGNDVTPEIIAFLFQKFNAFYLLTAAEATGPDAVPFLTYVDVEEAADECGYPDLYKTLAKRLDERGKSDDYSEDRIGLKEIPKIGGGAAKAASLHNLLKSASRSPMLVNEAKNDYRFVKHATKSVNDLNNSYHHLSDMYHTIVGLPKALEMSDLRMNKVARKVIKAIIFNKKADSRGYSMKTRPLLEAVSLFKDEFAKYAELVEEVDTVTEVIPEMVKDMSRADEERLNVGDVIEVTESIRGGFGAVPAGTIVKIMQTDDGNGLMRIRKKGGTEDNDVFIPISKLTRSKFQRVDEAKF